MLTICTVYVSLCGCLDMFTRTVPGFEWLSSDPCKLQLSSLERVSVASAKLGAKNWHSAVASETLKETLFERLFPFQE